MRVVGFNKSEYNKQFLDSLSPHEKEEYAMRDENSVIYDDIYTFFGELNDMFTNTEEYFWYAI